VSTSLVLPAFLVLPGLLPGLLPSGQWITHSVPLCGRRRSFLSTVSSPRHSVPTGFRLPPTESVGLPGLLQHNASQVLSQGLLRILDVDWLLAQAETFIMQRHQDLPPEAFLDPDVAEEAFNLNNGLVVLSYPWLSPQHPDPDGHHWRMVRQYLAKHVAQWYCETGSKFGVFWDYASLPQRAPDGTRTKEEQRALSAGLKIVNLLYGSATTCVVKLTSLPEGGTHQQLNVRPYSQRGWCVFEAVISGILKSKTKIVDLGHPEARVKLAEASSDWWEIVQAVDFKSTPICTPATMRRKLANLPFTCGSDREIVAQQYADFFNDVAPSLKHLKLWQWRGAVAAWDDEEVSQVIEALPHFVNTEVAFLSGNFFSDESLASILACLSKFPSFHQLDMCPCFGFSGSGFRALSANTFPALRILRLAESNIDDDGLSTLARQFRSLQGLKVLHLARCLRLRFSGFKALAAELPHLSYLEELWLGGTGLGDEAFRLLTKALPVLRNLRRLDFRDCRHITTVGVRTFARCMPHLPAMKPFRESMRRKSIFASNTTGGRQETCQHCLASMWAFAVKRTHFSCQACIRGVVWMPKRLQHTVEGELLAKCWCESGRACELLRWC